MENGTEMFTVIESFSDVEDAFYFFDTQLRELSVEGWEIQQGSGVQYVNHQWRAGLNFERPRKKEVKDLLSGLVGQPHLDAGIPSDLDYISEVTRDV